MSRIILGPQYIADPSKGSSIPFANIYIGEPDTDPEVLINQKQVQVQGEDGSITNVSQPIITGVGGVPLVSGSPVTILVDGSYSLKVTDSFGVQKYYVPLTPLFDPSAAVDSMVSLIALSESLLVGEDVILNGFYAGSIFGGGRFRWNATKSKLDHNGITIIDPSTSVTPGLIGWWVTTSVAGIGVWERLHNGDIDICMAGADKSIASNDLAINATLLLVKGADATGVGKSISTIRVPMQPGGSYHLTNKILIDGSHGFNFIGDGVLYQRNSPGDNPHTFVWDGPNSEPVIQVKGGAGIPSNPNFNIVIDGIGVLGRPTQSNTTSTAVAIAGIYLGALDGDSQPVLNRHVTIKNCLLENNRFGIFSGSPDGNNTDNADILIQKNYITKNYQAGVNWGTGNAICDLDNCYVVNNGYGASSYAADNYSAQLGGNIIVVGGQMRIQNYTSAGAGAFKPATADIYQISGVTHIDGAWSDTHGYFYKQSSATLSGLGYQVGSISGVRHFEGLMDITNTPDSIELRVPGTTVSSCTFYGNVRVTSGLSGRPVFSGIQFIRSGATYLGTGVDTQRSLIVLGNAGNNSQTLLGGADPGVSLTHQGGLVPQILSMGTSKTGLGATHAILQALGAAAADSSVTIYYNASGGEISFLINATVNGTSTEYTPQNINLPVWLITIGGVTSGIKHRVYDPNGSAATFTFAAFIDMGGLLVGFGNGTRDQAAYKHPILAADPTFNSVNYWEGGTYYNSTTNKLRVNIGTSVWVDLH